MPNRIRAALLRKVGRNGLRWLRHPNEAGYTQTDARLIHPTARPVPRHVTRAVGGIPSCFTHDRSEDGEVGLHCRLGQCLALLIGERERRVFFVLEGEVEFFSPALSHPIDPS